MAVGIPGNPAIYYSATAGSGIWKTDDGGQTWKCVSDSVRLTGVAAIAVAPSRPEIVYAGTSVPGPTAGLYRSLDGGEHWELVAFQGHTVGSIVIDPRHPEIVMAASGDAGVMRTTDGKNWKSVLPDEKVGGVWLVLDPDNPKNVYAGTRPISGGVFDRFAAPVTTPADDSHIYRSNDEGATWKKVSPDGLPGGNHGLISIAVAPGTKGKRIYDYIPQGVFRSDDGGEHWTRATTDPRLIGGGQFHDILVDPRDANVIYATQTSLYRSNDAGKTWESVAGAPSGADFNYVWIDPTNDKYMVFAVDQGTIVSMNGGRTFTSWFNQPTGQMYNVTTDHGFPFFMYSAQQDSGTVATPIFGHGGQITYRDWYTTNGFETAHILPDPADSNYLYATGWYGSILRINKITGQTQHVFERSGKYREAGNAPPMGFSPLDPETLYFGTQFLMATHDKGMHWQEASPDLTRAGREPSGRGGRGGGAGAGISALAFSPKEKTFWAGTSNGAIQVTRDGGANWSVVNPDGTPQSGSISMLEASPSNAARAFAIVTAPTQGGARGGPTPDPPKIFRTEDYGRTWRIVNRGLPNSVAWAVREDPVKSNLVFAALDAGVFVSFNNGDDWQSLELNLPAAWCRDLAIEQNDLIVATYGRALWALDNISPLRELASKAQEIASAKAYLYEPAQAIRMQWDTYTDTPLNPDVPAAQNPPDGAVIDYYLKSAASDIRMEIYDSRAKLVRAYSNKGPTSLGYKVNVPDFWLAPPALLPAGAGLHRFVWNLRYPDPDQLLYTYYGIHVDYFEYTLADHAIPHNTPWHEPEGPMVVPGRYEVRLTVDGTTYRQPLTVRLDPRLKVSDADLEHLLAFSQQIVDSMHVTHEAYNQAAKVRAEMADRMKNAAKESAEALKAAEKKLEAFTDAAGGFGPMNRDYTRLLIGVDQSDTAPASELIETYVGMCQQTRSALDRWRDLLNDEVPRLNRIVARQLEIPTEKLVAPNCGN